MDSRKKGGSYLLATLIFVLLGTLSLASALGFNSLPSSELTRMVGLPITSALIIIAIMNFAAAELAYRLYQTAEYTKKVHEESEYISELLEDIRNILRTGGAPPASAVAKTAQASATDS